MSKFQRVQQWSAFARNWYIYDAKWQNPFHSAKKITRVLEGRHKGWMGSYTHVTALQIQRKSVTVTPLGTAKKMSL